MDKVAEFYARWFAKKPAPAPLGWCMQGIIGARSSCCCPLKRPQGQRGIGVKETAALAVGGGDLGAVPGDKVAQDAAQ